MDYWFQLIREATDEAGVAAEDDQMKRIAEIVKSAHEILYRKELKKEKCKVACVKCGGHGSHSVFVGSHYIDSNCSNCNGEGFVIYECDSIID